MASDAGAPPRTPGASVGARPRPEPAPPPLPATSRSNTCFRGGIVEDPGVLLTGEGGVGKSTTLATALHPLNPIHYEVCYLAVGEG
jgi:hypothetical protein